MGIFVAIAGNIGSGKTTLTKKMSDYFGWQPFFESVKDNPYLEDFYQNMKEYALHLQVYFLTKRFYAHQAIVDSDKSAIQDRTIYEDYEIFTKNLYLNNNMTKRDYETYQDLFNIMKKFLKSPDVLIYLRGSVKMLRKRIIERGRSYEQTIPDIYLEQLNQRYDEWVYNWKESKVIIFDIDKIDFKNKEEDFKYVCETVINSLPQREIFDYKKI